MNKRLSFPPGSFKKSSSPLANAKSMAWAVRSVMGQEAVYGSLQLEEVTARTDFFKATLGSAGHHLEGILLSSSSPSSYSESGMDCAEPETVCFTHKLWPKFQRPFKTSLTAKLALAVAQVQQICGPIVRIQHFDHVHIYGSCFHIGLFCTSSASCETGFEGGLNRQANNILKQGLVPTAATVS